MSKLQGNIATLYRPKKFSEVVGQDLAVAALKRIAASEGITVRSIFLKGAFGSGKSTLARIFGRALNCTEFHKLGDVCNECAHCKESMAPNSQLYLEFDSSIVGNVESIRALTEKLSIYSKGRRLVVFDEIQAASNAALNALLKVVEEGIPNTIFMFLSTEDILGTIKSRSLCIDIGLIPHDMIVRRVAEVAKLRNLPITESQLDLIAIKSQGHMRNALSILQFFELCGDRALESSFLLVRDFIFKSLQPANRAEAIKLLDEVLKFNIVDIKNSILILLKSFYTSPEGTPENVLLKKGIAASLFNFFFSPVSTQAMNDEVGMEILLRAFYEKACKTR